MVVIISACDHAIPSTACELGFTNPVISSNNCTVVAISSIIGQLVAPSHTYIGNHQQYQYDYWLSQQKSRGFDSVKNRNAGVRNH